jgi:hypothetical protein
MTPVALGRCQGPGVRQESTQENAYGSVRPTRCPKASGEAPSVAAGAVGVVVPGWVP